MGRGGEGRGGRGGEERPESWEGAEKRVETSRVGGETREWRVAVIFSSNSQTIPIPLPLNC